MITTVTLNPAIDRTIAIDKFNFGSVNKVISSRQDIGGKGINAAKVIKLLNIDVTSIGFLGSQNKDIFVEFFEQENMKNDFVFIDDKTRINTKLVDLYSKETTDLNETGFAISKDNYNLLLDKVIFYAKQSEYMMFGGSLPPGLNDSTYYGLISAAGQYTKCILDASGGALREGVKAKPFLIKPNINELASAFNAKLNSIEDIINQSNEIINTYEVQNILVSMGKDGALLINRDGVLKSEPIKITPKSTVGAGDTMLGGFISEYIKTNNYEKALKMAAACGTLAVLSEGTGISLEELDDIINKVIIKKIM